MENYNTYWFYSGSTDIVTIICLVDGEFSEHAFAVDIGKKKLISHLKGEIKNKMPSRFTGVDADQLTLWKINIPDDDDAALQDLVLIDDEANFTRKLWPTRTIEDALGDLAVRHIHILVALPVIDKVIRCKVTYIRKLKSF